MRLMRFPSFSTSYRFTQVITFIAQISLTACTTRDVELEKLLTEKLEQLKNSSTSAVSMNLNEILGKDWKKICVQGAYTPDDDFEKESREKIHYLLSFSGSESNNSIFYNDNLLRTIKLKWNESAIWVFYADGSIRTMILNRNVLDFGVYKSKNGSPTICTSIKYPTLYITSKYSESYRQFHFKNEE